MPYEVEQIDVEQLKSLNPESTISVIMDRDITGCYHPSDFGSWANGENLIEPYGSFVEETMRQREFAVKKYQGERNGKK